MWALSESESVNSALHNTISTHYSVQKINGFNFKATENLKKLISYILPYFRVLGGSIENIS